MKKNNRVPVILFFIFCLLLSITTLISFSSNTTTQEVLIKSIKPVYDETSTIEVDNNNVVFNDKNQVVKYNVVLENTQNYDVKISDIKLSTPTEEFLQYKVEGISTEDVLEGNSTKELVVSFETMRIDGWGRNFADELTANISFEKVAKQEEIPPVEEDKEEEKQPEAPATNIEEVINKSEKIEVSKITNNTIEFKEDIKVELGDKVAVWIYSEPIFLGYFDVVVTNGIKQIAGLEDALKKAQVETGEHSIVLATEEKEVLGYVNIYINENKELLIEKPQDPTDKEDSTINKPSEDLEEKPKEDETGKVENPYTSDKELVGILCIATCITGVAVIVASKNKLTKYTVFILMLSPAFTITNAEEVIEVSLKNNISFKSQNVMKKSFIIDENKNPIYNDYWVYREQLKNFYISNEIHEITDYAYKFDVTEKGNGKVMAYLVTNKDNANFYDLYLQADGIIYPNPNAREYFYKMRYLDKIDNIAGLDTSEVTNMYFMFSNTGQYSKVFTLDISTFDTSNVTNMAAMFQKTGYDNVNFTLNLGDFDTSKVTNMNSIFNQTGYNSTIFELDVSNFDTSKVTNMLNMFTCVGYNNPNFTLNVSNFDTSNVTDMSAMFYYTGYSNPNFTLDVSNFDTANVTNMSYMFSGTGYSSTEFTLDVSNFDTSKVTDMSYMFADAGYNSTEFSIDVSKFDTSNLVNAEAMFYNLGYSSNKVDTSFTIKNSKVENYLMIFNFTAQNADSQMKINYTSETEELVDKMIATKTKNANVVKGNLIVDVDNLSTGDEIHISGEKFNVISQTDDTVTMLAKYNLGTDYKQSTTENHVAFTTSSNGWGTPTEAIDLDIQTNSSAPKMYVNEYVQYLKNVLNDNSVNGTLISLKELKVLGCIINDDYLYEDGITCENSQYKSWIVNAQAWWTRSARTESNGGVFAINNEGKLVPIRFSFSVLGIRPTITITKESLKEYLKA